VNARLALREATAEAHERVDRLFSGLRLNDPDDYRLFLLAQAAAHLPVEAALDQAGAERHLPCWPERRRAALLRADLAEMGASEPAHFISPSFSSAAEILGAIYVLEGSRLGGAVLKRALDPSSPRRFLTAPQPPGGWRSLGHQLDAALTEPALLSAAMRAARGVFEVFYEAGQRHVPRTDRRAA
jgi:heme oxygenase